MRCIVCGWLFWNEPPTDHLCDECRPAVQDVLAGDDLTETAAFHRVNVDKLANAVRIARERG
jgi:hypothetical protein